MIKMRKKLAVAVTIAILAFPLSASLTLADTVTPSTTTTVSDISTTDTTVSDITTTDTTGSAITTTDTTGSAITTTDTTGSAITTADQAEAEAAVAAYEAGPITTLAEVASAEGLKAAADTAVAEVTDVTAKTAFELRITNRATAIATAKLTLTPVVDASGNQVAPENWFTNLIGKLQSALTFNPVRKCEINEHHALANLAKAQELMKEGKTEAAQIYLTAYSDKVALALSFLDQVKDPTSETAINLNQALVNANSNNIQVLSNLLDKLPPQAAQKLALNVVRSMEKAVSKMQKEETTPVSTSSTTPASITATTSGTITAPTSETITPPTSGTSTATTPVTDRKSMEKQAKAALKEFKKSLKQKGKIHLEDQDQQENEDQDVAEQSKPEQETPEMEQNSQPVIQDQTSQAQSKTKSQPAPKTQTAPNIKASEHSKEDRNKPEVHENHKGGNKEGNKKNDK